MRKIQLLLALILASFAGYAQLSRGGIPYSFKNMLNDRIDAAKVVMPRLNTESLRAAAQEAYRKGEMLPAGKILPANYSPGNSGVWSRLANGDKVWRLRIQVPGAPATALYYENFYLPAGATLFIYNAEQTHVIGSFGEHNNNISRLFATELIYTDECIVEYYEPAGVKQSGAFVITGVANVYNAPAPPANIHLKDTKCCGLTNTSGACNVNVNCPEGDSWANQKKGVARILVKTGADLGWCTGSLVNTARADFKNYFLTANHCGGAVSAADKNQWIFYFNYQAAGCADPVTEPGSNTITGCTMRASSSNGANSDVAGSDFLLVEFNSSIPANYNVYYAGWDASGAGSNSGVGIHHPAGDIKKISTYTAALSSTSYSAQSPANSHWQANWVQTVTNYGITEGGSSGSPLFNSIGRVVGQLSGGNSSCTATVANKNDYYGKFSYDWTSNGAPASQQLKPWLDPDNTGITSLGGSIACSQDITITGSYADPVTQSSTWIKSAGQTTIANNTSVKLDADPNNGYILFMPASGTDFLLSAPGASGVFTVQALDGCGTGLPARLAAAPATITLTPANTRAATVVYANSHFQAFPNPVTGILTVQHPARVQQLQLYNAMGTAVLNSRNHNKNSTQLDVSRLPTGVYFLYADGQAVEKIVKQ